MSRIHTTRLVTFAATASIFLSLGASAFAAVPASAQVPVGPDATGPAKFGLCTAYFASAQAQPTNLGAVAFKNLSAAAVKANSPTVDAFCGTTTVTTTDTTTDSTTGTAVVAL